MIDKVYGKYFQKSRSFLYPALGIKRTSNFTPIGTYISLSEKISADDMKLICVFKKDTSEGFQNFENQMLTGNPLFEEKLEIENMYVYIFDYSIYMDDWFNFILGRYSKFSSVLKKAIKSFYGEKTQEYKYIESYLYPDKYFDTYAKLLNVNVETLKSIGELCNPCDLEKENLKIPTEHAELINKM